jgi:hypothetical protein
MRKTRTTLDIYQQKRQKLIESAEERKRDRKED